MILRALTENTINIHALTLGLPERPHYQPEALFERLKTTPLYDSIGKRWHSHLERSGVIGSSYIHADAQLWAIFAEAQFNREGASQAFEELKNSPLYDKETNQWNWNIDTKAPSEVRLNNYRFSEIQLVGVLVETAFDPHAGAKLYQALQKTPLYDNQLKQWNYCMSAKQEHFSSEVASTNTELLSLFVEKILNLPKSNAQFQLPQELFSNKEIPTYQQILSVLVNSEFNLEAAVKQYEQLKQSKLFDREEALWNYNNENLARLANVQFLAIAIEARLREKTKDRLEARVVPLPTLRKI